MLRFLRKLVTWPYRRYIREMERRERLRRMAEFDTNTRQNVRITTWTDDPDNAVIIRDWDYPPQWIKD